MRRFRNGAINWSTRELRKEKKLSQNHTEETYEVGFSGDDNINYLENKFKALAMPKKKNYNVNSIVSIDIQPCSKTTVWVIIVRYVGKEVK